MGLRHTRRARIIYWLFPLVAALCLWEQAWALPARGAAVPAPALAVPQPGPLPAEPAGSDALSPGQQVQPVSSPIAPDVSRPGGSAPSTPVKVPKAPKLSAKAAVLMDATTGKVLFANNAYARRAPASLTKMLTAIVALEKGNLDSVAKVSANAAKKPPSRLGLSTGDRISLGDLLEAALLGSSNDAATAIAEHIAGSEAAFARYMNQTAVKLGARQSNFVNPHGLDAASHYSTAYDLALIARKALQIPQIAALAVQERANLVWQGGRSEVVNINSFLWRYNGAIGLKTGYTNNAGYSVAAAAKRDNNTLIAILLGCPSSEARWSDAVQLMDYGFTNFNTLLAASREVKTYTVRKGDTLSGIASRFGVRLNDLLAANPALKKQPNRLYPGQVLVLP